MNKDAFSSQYFRGLLFLLAGPLFARYGVTEEMLQEVITGVSMAVGVALSWYGRQRANGQITTIARIPLPKVLIPDQQKTEGQL